MSEELLSTRQVAEILGITQRQVQRLAKNGDLPKAFKVGHAWLIPVSDLDDYINNQKRKRQART